MVSALYRRIAIAELLSTADPSPFFQNLFKSGRTFLHFLQHAPDAEKTISKSEPLFDAIACRDREGAATLAKSSRMMFASGKEYQEDFFYIRFLIDRLIVGACRRARLSTRPSLARQFRASRHPPPDAWRLP